MNERKKKFSIIPVIDIMNGYAVHAIKGMRNKYEPLKSNLVDSSSPIDLIKAYFSKFSFSDVYIADLDSIIHEKLNITLLKSIHQSTALDIMLDAGVRNLYDIIKLKDLGVKIILATETLDSLNVVNEAVNKLGSDKIIVSIDMKNKVIMARNPEIKNHSILSLIDDLKMRGITDFILLDLAKVGSKCGSFDNEYIEIRKKNPDIKIMIGGGVKNIEDLISIREQEFDGVLIATILHENIITPKDLQEFYNN